MATQALNLESFQTAVKGPGMWVIDFWAEWCGPCRTFGPTFEKVSERTPGVSFGKVDVDAEPQLAGALGIRSIPTLMVVREGVVLYAEAGALPEAAFEELLRRAQSVNMDDVRAEIAKQKSAPDEAE